ncbi:MAG: DUF5320 domain-containing protein [Tissierellia bacterium]|nr:DUF5320 domain-containing protein [Tissierellia bacterium]
MPRRNGMGPMGMGPMTGRGMGFCRPRVYGYERRMGRFTPWVEHPISAEDEKNFLKNEKAALETRLNEIEKILENFEE